MEEIWKDVVGFEGLYQVSNIGRVKSLPKLIHSRTPHYTQEKILRSHPKKNGYIGLVLRKNGESINKTLHVLIAEAFLQKPLNAECVNHKDGNKANNCVENLEWITFSENIYHAYKHGLKIKEGCLTIDEINEVRALSKMGYSNGLLGRFFNVDSNIIYNIIEGNTRDLVVYKEPPIGRLQQIRDVLDVDKTYTKLSVNDVKEIKRLIGKGMSIKDIACLFGISACYVSDIKQKRAKTEEIYAI